MGLDWCLNRKPRPGREQEFVVMEAQSADDWTDEQKDHWDNVSVSPYETMGVPRIGIDEVATRHFFDVIVPSHRENASKREPDDTYRKHWEQSDDALLAEHTGAYATDLTDYEMSTFQVMAPFTSMAGAFSFRGKVIGYNPLLTEELQNEAYTDMTPLQMADYAGRIEAAALASVREQVGMLPPFLNGGDAREWMEQTKAGIKERAESEGYVLDDWTGWTKDGHHLQLTATEELAYDLEPVLDAARWLRFWADLGHGMHAWY